MTPPLITKTVHVDLARAVKDPSYALSCTRDPCFCVYDKRFSFQVLGDSPELTLVESRDVQFAHEAGVYIKSTNSVYFTANFQTVDPVDLFAIDCDSLVVKKLDYPAVIQANGACNYNDRVLYCSQGNLSSPSELTLVDPATGCSETLLNNFHGRTFNSLNDVVVHHETGDIWFTDPTYGHMQGFRPEPVLPPQVYRFRPLTSECWAVADGFEQCNGLCFSPDYTRMYVTDTGAIQAHHGVGDGHQMSYDPRKPATIYVYDVIDKKCLGNRRVFAYVDNGVPDGIKCDENGFVYSGCGDGVHCWDEKGTIIGKIVVGTMTANFCFVKGGMWMFNERELYFCRLKGKGALVKIECE